MRQIMISDLDARTAALNPQRSFIVQAPAGSGKTGLLVYRILTLLATVDQPQKVLAITFTRKATSEMLARLQELLRCAEQGESSDDAFEQQGIALAQDVLVQDKKYGWNLLDSPHQLQILTIDAFSARLAGSMPWLSRLGDRPRTTDEATLHYAAAIESLFTELLNDDSDLLASLQTVLLEMDFNYNRARQLFASMLAKRDQWLRHLLSNDLSKLRGYIEQAWQSLVNEQVSQVNELMDSQQLEELLEIGREAAGNIEAKEGKESLLVGFENFDRSVRLFGLGQWQALRHMLLTGEGKWRKQINKNIGFLPKTPLKAVIQEKLVELSEGYEELRLALIEIDSLPSANFSDEDWQQLLALESVLKSLAARLQLRFRSVGECDHSEVTQRANLALQELQNPTDLGLRLDAQLQHILVDEFQDTSHGQIELLKRLTLGWSKIEDGFSRTLFLVGDPMQSIYRFREADVSLFLRVAANDTSQVFPNIQIEPLVLTENFRSSSSLVNWFNATFQSSFPERNDFISSAIQYAPATSKKPENLPCAETLLAHDKVQEANLLVELVKAEINNLPTEDDRVAILVRSRGHLRHLLPALQQAGLNYVGVDIQPLNNVQAVMDVLALCKSICRQDNRIAWLALLRGPWCGLSLKEIKQLAGRADQTVWQQLNSQDLSALEVNSKQRLGRFLVVMKAVFEQRQRVELASLTRWAWMALGGESTLLGASIDDIETVFKLIGEQQRGGDLASLSELDKALDGLYARPAQGVANEAPKLIISTIHKAKGLQYHTVILPCLGNMARAESKEIMMWAEYQNASGGSQLLLAPLVLNETDKNSHYSYLRLLDKKRSTNEAVRLMYVACTRAEQKLVLLGCTKSDEESGETKPPVVSSLLGSIWNATQDDFSFPYIQEHNDDAELQNNPQTLSRLPANFQPATLPATNWQLVQQHSIAAPMPPVDSQTLEYEWATEVATAVGIVLHDCLQFNGSGIFNLSIDQALKKRWNAELRALRVPANRIDYALKRLTKALNNIQTDKDTHFLFKDYAEQQNEYALSALEDGVVNTYRIDRTFVDEQGVRWIVDYKSTDTRNQDIESFVDEQIKDRHQDQLERYGRLMSQIDAKPIRLAVYFPLLKQLRSWEYRV